MNNTALQVFNFQEREIRTFIRDGATSWVAKDICDILAIGTEQVRRLDEDEKDLHKTQTLGGEQEMSIISESGLYNLIFCSRKPDAKKFKKWITSEVLPALWKTGKFDMGQSTAAPTVSSMPLMEKLNGMLIHPVTRNDKPWWIVNDVCAILEIASPHNVVARLPEDDLCQADVIDSMGRVQSTNITHEALPAIRKTGKFAMKQSAAPTVSARR